MTKHLNAIEQTLSELPSRFRDYFQPFYADIKPSYIENNAYQKRAIVERLTVPDRVIQFKVAWENDKGEIEVNQGWRVQYLNILGPYKGGIRFHPQLDESILNLLAFEQTLKCALTGLPMGGAKGGANFNPKGRSEREVRRFCHAFMDELHHYIGVNTDIPAGDLGVGQREIGYMFGRALTLTREFNGILTGKHPNFGGSCGRLEATGYGVIYFSKFLLNQHNESLEGKKCLISGAGSVALYTAEKAIHEKAKVLTLSDRTGTLYFRHGLSQSNLDSIIHAKIDERISLQQWHEKAEQKSVEFQKNEKPWGIKADIALPCATENEINLTEIKKLHANKIRYIIEGANLPLTLDAIEYAQSNKIIFAPGIAANAGGVAVSNFERSQNATHSSWSLDEVEKKLCEIMQKIHDNCTKHNYRINGELDYKKGAHVYSFKHLAGAMLSYS